MKELGLDVDGIYPDGSRSNISEDDDNERPGSEHSAPERVGSTESLDHINEDFNRNEASRATGYMGKTSEVTWMQRLKRHARYDSENEDEGSSKPMPDSIQTSSPSGRQMSREHGPEPLPPRIEKNRSITESTYYCDDLPVVIDSHIDPYDIPMRNIADFLLTSYLESVHPAFPILDKAKFVEQYQMFFGNGGIDNGQDWLAILNLIFAIGAKYAQLTHADIIGNSGQDEIYFARARLLGLNSETILAHADLQRIQVTGLSAFYLMATCQVNRYKNSPCKKQSANVF